MQLTVSGKELDGALNTIGRVVVKNCVKPVLRCVRLDVNGSVELAGTNLETAVTARLQGYERHDDAVTACLVSFEKLAAIAKRNKKGTLTIRGTRDRDQVLARYRTKRAEGVPAREAVRQAKDTVDTVEIANSRTTHTLPTMSIEDYPIIGTPAPTCATVSGAEIKRMISQTVFAAAKSATRYAINGILLEIENGKVQFAATDGRRLAIAETMACETNPAPQCVIVPVKAMMLLDKLLPKKDIPSVKIAIEWKVLSGDEIEACQVYFSVCDVTIGALPVEGLFPLYEDVVPRDPHNIVECETDDLLDCLGDVMLTTSDENKSAKVTCGDDGEMVLESNDLESSASCAKTPISWILRTNNRNDKGEILADYIPEFYINPHFLQEGLKAAGGRRVRIAMYGPSRPVLLTSATSCEFRCVLMPGMMR